MNHFILSRSIEATPHPTTTPGKGKLFIDATDISTFIRVGNDINTAEDKFGFADFSQITVSKKPRLINKEIDFLGFTERHLTSGSAGFIFSNSDGYSIFALARSSGLDAAHVPLIDFGSFTTKVSMGYARNIIQGVSPTASGGVFQSTLIANTTAYRRLSVVVEFGVKQTTYINNILIKQDSITLTQITAAEIDESSTRQAFSGPVTIGLQSNTTSDNLATYQGFLKCLFVYSSKISDIGREKLDNFMRILEAR